MFEAGNIGAEPNRSEARSVATQSPGKPIGGVSRLLLECVEEPAIYLLDARGCLVGRNVGAARLERGETCDPPGEPFSLLYSAEEIRQGKPKQDLATAASEGRLEMEGWRVRADGTTFWAETNLAAVRDTGRRLEGFILFLRELTDDQRDERPTRAHAQRQEAMVRFASAALSGMNPDRLLEAAVRLAAEELNADMGLYLEASPADRTLLLRAGVGIREDAVGHMRVNLPTAVLLGRASRSMNGASLEELCAELGRDVPVALRRQGIVNGTLAPVDGGRYTFGVLAVYSRKPRVFDARDRSFLNELASLLGQGVERWEAEGTRNRFAAVMKETTDCVAVLDPRGRLVYVNPAACKARGIPESEDVAGQNLASWLSARSASLVLQEGIPTALSEGMWSGETTLIDRQGKEVPVSQVIVAHQGSDGEVVYLSTTLRDVAHAKSKEGNLRLLAEVGSELIGVLDQEAALSTVRRLVLPRLADICFIDLIEGGDVRRVVTAHRDREREPLLSTIGSAAIGIHSVLETGKPELVPDVSDAWIWAATLDHERFESIRRLEPRSAMIVPLVAGDRSIGVLWLIYSESGRRYDATDLLLAQELGGRVGAALDALRVHQQALQETRLRDEVLGIVAHDLRNPLHTICMAVNVLEGTNAAPTPTQRKYIEIIRRSAHEATRLVQDLHNVTLLESGHLSMHPRSLLVDEVARDALDLFRPLAEDRGIQLTSDVPEGLGRVRADRGRVLQVFSNLIGNAIRYTEKGGHITLDAESQRDRVRFSVADTGRGIAETEIPHLFERSRHPVSTVRPGLGLGIARSIVESHGGEIWVESALGGGTTFFFTLPSER